MFAPESQGETPDFKTMFAPAEAPSQSWGEAFAEGGKTLTRQTQEEAQQHPYFPPVPGTETIPALARGAYKAITEPSSIPGMAEKVAKHLYDRYLTEEGWKKAVATDPKGVATDIVTLALVPEAVAAKGVKGAIAAEDAARVANLPERIATLPEKPLPAAQRAAALKTQAGAQMNVAKASEEALPTTTLDPIVTDLKAKAAAEGYNPRIHKSAKALFREFDNLLATKEPSKQFIPLSINAEARARTLARNPELISQLDPAVPTTTIKDIHQLRQQIRSVSGSADVNERAIGRMMKDSLDEYMGQFMEGKTLTEGMKDYAKASTALEVKHIADRAQLRMSQRSHQNLDDALSTEFRQFAKNEKKMRMLRAVSPEAATRVENVAKGGGTFQQILRGLGSAAPKNIMSFSLDNIAGHLLHGIIPGGPYTIMGIGAGAKWLAGKGTAGSIEAIQDAILAEPNLKTLQKALDPPKGPSVFQHLMSKPGTAQAVRQWANASSTRKKVASAVLATAIAKELNRPDLHKRIQDEIENLEPNTTIVPKVMAQK
jgi:hypothetical protein